LSGNKTTVAIVFGGLLVVAVAAIAIFGDLGHEDVPDDAVAVVDGEAISQADFDRALDQAAAQQGLPEAPPPDDSQYEALRDQALNSLLDSAWIFGEGEEQGVEVTDREVEQEFEQTKSQNFGSEQEYQEFLQQSGFTQEDIDERVRLQLISTKIQDEVLANADKVTDEEARDYYDANKEQFEQPESRNIRIVLNSDEAAAQQAFDRLSADNSPENWSKVAKELSTDQTTKNSGGVREGVTSGALPEPLNADVFEAEQGQVTGPVETPEGFYVFQVDSITPAGATSFDEARPQIDQQLDSQLQQEAFSAFVADYRDRWTEVTVCSDEVLSERCENFTVEATPCDLEEQEQQQASLPEEQRQEPSCPAPVFAAGGGAGPTPAAPGTIVPFVPAAGQPQHPHPPGEETAAPPTGLPGGTFPGGGGAVPVQPGG
jgi:parvulin-like peptidyl-prolyl isomerase